MDEGVSSSGLVVKVREVGPFSTAVWTAVLAPSLGGVVMSVRDEGGLVFESLVVVAVFGHLGSHASPSPALWGEPGLAGVPRPTWVLVVEWLRGVPGGAILSSDGGPQVTVDFSSVLSSLEKREFLRACARSAGSCPGLSQFKVAFARRFPGVSEALCLAWSLLWRWGVAPDHWKTTLLVSIPKQAGGYRPIGLVEESLKVLEGIPMRRFCGIADKRPGSVLSRFNYGFAAGLAGCAEVLHSLFLVLFDYGEAVREGDLDRELLVVFIDYSSFFNTIQSRIVDAVLGERGAPVAFRRLLHEVDRGSEVVVSPPWGLSGSFPHNRGGHQGGLARRVEAALRRRG